jgi:hypothetical protein
MPIDEKYTMFDFSRICRVANFIGAMCGCPYVEVKKKKKPQPNIHLTP